MEGGRKKEERGKMIRYSFEKKKTDAGLNPASVFLINYA